MISFIWLLTENYDLRYRRALKYHLAKVSHIYLKKFGILFHQRSNKLILSTASKIQPEYGFQQIVLIDIVRLTLADWMLYKISEP